MILRGMAGASTGESSLGHVWDLFIPKYGPLEFKILKVAPIGFWSTKVVIWNNKTYPPFALGARELIFQHNL